VEVLRFGPGFRRSASREGRRGVADGTIWADPRARITELAFSRRALITPETSPDLGLFVVVAGGGWVQVGDERTTIDHGEAVAWPPGVAHAAWTDGSTMRAILVEVPDLAVLGSAARTADGPTQAEPTPARGRLAAREVRPEDHDLSEGEPW
jgi:quercetin dioxygenase-like cupin family protein